MSDIYRHMPDVLGEAEREEEAVRVLGRWRDRMRMRVLVAFALPGLIPALIVYWWVQELQFSHNHGRAFLVINVGAASVCWAAVLFAGAMVARRVLRARTPAKVTELAKAYEIPEPRLVEIANLISQL